MNQVRPDEELAFKVVGRVLDVSVCHYDKDGRQGAFDAKLHYPDGHVAALETSSLGTQDEARITNVLARGARRRDVAGLTGVWYAVVPNTFHPADLDHLDAALVRCEELGLKRLRYALGEPAIRTLLEQGVHAFVLRTTGATEPRAYVHVRGVGGFIGEGIEPLPDELADVLRTPEMRSKIEKLARSGLKERHLFLSVRPSAFSFPVYDGLSFRQTLPTRPARLPEGLSQVWLFTGYAEGGVVRAAADGAWYRNDADFAEVA